MTETEGRADEALAAEAADSVLAAEALEALADAGLVKYDVLGAGDKWLVKGAIVTPDGLEHFGAADSDRCATTPRDPVYLAGSLAAALQHNAAQHMRGLAAMGLWPPKEAEDDSLGAELLAAEGEGGQDSGDEQQHHDHGGRSPDDDGGAGGFAAPAPEALDEGGGERVAADDFIRADEDGDGASVSEGVAGGDGRKPDPIDADFDLGVFSVEAPATDASFLIENRPDDIEVEEPQSTDPGGVAYFGDNLDQQRTALAGIVSRLAEEKVSAIEATIAELPDEFASLQGFVISNLDKFTGAFSLQDDESLAKYARWNYLDRAHWAIIAVDRHRRDITKAVLAASRAEIEAFDPEAGWPDA